MKGKYDVVLPLWDSRTSREQKAKVMRKLMAEKGKVLGLCVVAERFGLERLCAWSVWMLAERKEKKERKENENL